MMKNNKKYSSQREKLCSFANRSLLIYILANGNLAARVVSIYTIYTHVLLLFSRRELRVSRNCSILIGNRSLSILYYYYYSPLSLREYLMFPRLIGSRLFFFHHHLVFLSFFFLYRYIIATVLRHFPCALLPCAYIAIMKSKCN